MAAPPSLPNVGSQLDRAIVAYLISSGLSVPGFAGDATCIFPAYTWRQKAYPCVIVHSQRSQHDPPMSGVQKYQTQIRVEQSEITNAAKTGQELQRVNLDLLVGQVLYAMLQTTTQADLDYTAGQITTAARALAVADPANNGDLATFTLQHLQHTGDTRGEPSEEGASWVEIRNFQCDCNPSNT